MYISYSHTCILLFFWGGRQCIWFSQLLVARLYTTFSGYSTWERYNNPEI